MEAIERRTLWFNMIVNRLARGLLILQLWPALVFGKSASSNTPLYKDPSAPVEKRVKDLLGRMTIEDKMAQLMQGTLREKSEFTIKAAHFKLRLVILTNLPR